MLSALFIKITISRCSKYVKESVLLGTEVLYGLVIVSHTVEPL